MRKLSLMLVLALILTTLGGFAAAEADKPYEGVTLRVGAEAEGLYTLWFKEHVHEFTEKTGIIVEIVEVPELTNTFTIESMAGSGYFDLLNMDGPVIPEFAENGWLEPLNDYFEEGYLDDFYPSAIDAVSYDGSVYAIPYLVHGPLIYYRTDLFEKAGLPGAPTTVDEYREYAKMLTDLDAGMYGTIIEGRQGGEPVSQLHDKIYQFGGEVLTSDLEVAFDSQQVIDMFNWILALQWEDKSCPEAGVNYHNGDVQNMFLQGNVAMVCNWPYMWSMTKDPATSKVVGNVAVAPQPITNALWSWSYAIHSDSKNKEAAYEFLKWTVESENLGKMGAEFSNPVTRISSVDIALNSLTDESDIATFKAMMQMLEQGKAPNLTTNYSAIRSRMGETLNKIVSRAVTDVEAEVKACAEDMRVLVDEVR